MTSELVSRTKGSIHETTAYGIRFLEGSTAILLLSSHL
jgi:hypothetical protein